MDLFEILDVFLIIAMGVLAIAAAILHSRDQEKSGTAWSQAAQETGLDFLDRGAEDQELRGHHRGFRTRIRVRTETERRGRYNELVYYTIIEIDARQEAIRAAMVRPRKYEEVPPVLRKEQGQSFAATFLLHTDSLSGRLFQDDEIRAEFLEILNTGDTIQLQAGRLKRVRQELFTDASRLVLFLDSATDLMDRLDIKARQLQPPALGDPHVQEHTEEASNLIW